MGKKSDSSTILLLLMILGVVVLLAKGGFGSLNLPSIGQSEEGVSVMVSDINGDPINKGGNLFSLVTTPKGTFEGAGYISFKVKATNTGAVTYTSMNIKSATDSGTSLGGTMYEALKADAGATPQTRSNIATGQFAEWTTRYASGVGAETCSLTTQCDANEVCVGSGTKMCQIPVAGLETTCASGCTFVATVEGTYTYGGTPTTQSQTSSVLVTIRPDPVAGFTVTVEDY